MALVLLFGLIIILAMYIAWIFNQLTSLRNRIQNAWSDIDVFLKRRHDLIPNIVETVKGYASHEKQTLESVVKARDQSVSARSSSEISEAQSNLTQSIRYLMVLAENYPDLKANQGFLGLQIELKETEDWIENSRRYYNAVVRDYNTMIESFPQLWVSRQFGFTQKDFFKLSTDTERSVPRVDLN